jgi:chromosome partitioning protein
MAFEELFSRLARFGKAAAAPPPLSAANPTLPAHTCQVAVINHKGGCGKTTTAVNLSACLVELGCRVLLIDLDPQAHATLALGFQGDELSVTLYDALKPGGIPVSQVIHPTYHPNLKLIPANAALGSLQIELVHQPDRERALQRCLAPVDALFHFIFIDCPPSMSLLTLNALTAATHAMIPTLTDYLSLDGMRELFKTIQLVRAEYNPRLELLGILPTLFDQRTSINRAMLDTMRQYFKGHLFDTVIHRHASLIECPMAGQPVTRYAPGARGAHDYRQLAEELLAKTDASSAA